MSTTYFKAVRPNGRDLHSNTVQWAPEDPSVDIPEGGVLVEHPRPVAEDSLG